jgi:hypothetical protein
MKEREDETIRRIEEHEKKVMEEASQKSNPENQEEKNADDESPAADLGPGSDGGSSRDGGTA